MRPVRFWGGWGLLCAGFAACAFACSGAEGRGLFGPAGDGDAAVNGDGGGDPFGDGGALDGTLRDGAGPNGDDGGPKRDADEPEAATVFPCGPADAGMELTRTAGAACCATQVDQILFINTSLCVHPSAQCTAANQGIISCHNGGDCGGKFCCGDLGTTYRRVACAATCDSAKDAGGDDHRRFCDPKLNNAECNPGETCSVSSVLPGFYRCGVP